MKPAVVNFCSNAAEMLWLSSYSALVNEPTDFHYLVMLWSPSEEAEAVAVDLEKRGAQIIRYDPDPAIDFVPNLRRMMSHGFEAAFQFSDYAGIINTDCFLGPLWLTYLAKYAEPGVIVNAQHITPGARGGHVIHGNLGIPERGAFDVAGFYDVWRSVAVDRLETEEKRGGWLNTNTMPYLFHRQWWERCGPWELEVGREREPPDRRFFRRCHDAGARFAMSMGSVCYHAEAVERRAGTRPRGAVNMPEGV